MKTALTIKPIPIVRITIVSLSIAARIKKVISAAHINSTRSIAGILSVIPDITARNVGIKEESRKISPIQPIDSAVLGLSLCCRKFFTEHLMIESFSNQLTFVEDVFSNFGDSLFFPSGVDVICMIKKCVLFNDF